MRKFIVTMRRSAEGLAFFDLALILAVVALAVTLTVSTFDRIHM